MITRFQSAASVRVTTTPPKMEEGRKDYRAFGFPEQRDPFSMNINSVVKAIPGDFSGMDTIGSAEKVIHMDSCPSILDQKKYVIKRNFIWKTALNNG